MANIYPGVFFLNFFRFFSSESLISRTVPSNSSLSKVLERKRNRPNTQASARGNIVRINGLASDVNASCFNCQVEIRSPSCFVSVETGRFWFQRDKHYSPCIYNVNFAHTVLSPVLSSRISNFEGTPIPLMLGQVEPHMYLSDSCSLRYMLGKNVIQSLAL